MLSERSMARPPVSRMRTVTLASTSLVVEGSWSTVTGKVALPSSPTTGRSVSGVTVASAACSSARPNE